MVNWNPSAPEVLGNEWLSNIGLTNRVWGGAPAAMARYPSTLAETITALKMSATLNPLSAASIPTLVDVIEEGNEDSALFAPVYLAPNSDVQTLGWRRHTGETTGLYQMINESTRTWPTSGLAGTAGNDWILNGIGNEQAYICSVDATPFAAGGTHVNGRIGFVSISAILGANTGYRKLRLGIQIAGQGYLPAGGNTREVHYGGAMYTLWYGELNPATGKPWTPADIANFGTAGNARIYVQTVATSGTQYPIVWALALEVYALPVENRAAVGVWRRPEAIASRLTNVTTDALVTVPSGAANWSKLSSRNYLYYWRQSVAPSEYGPVVGDDARWNCIRQGLPSNGQPPGFSPPPGGVIGSMGTAHDNFGRPTVQKFEPYQAHSVFGLALVRLDAATSTDSVPYRLDIADLLAVTSTQTAGQRITPGANATYNGVRFVIAPPPSGNPTLTVKVRRVSDSVQMGGTFTITAAEVRALPDYLGWRYIDGFLSSGAALVSGTAYEIQFSTTTGGNWTVAMPDCSLGNTASFGGSTNGAFIGSTHFPDRELVVNLVRQPDPPTGAVAAITNVPVTSPTACSVTQVQHVQVTWVAPASPLGSLFARYELERQLDGETTWTRIASVINAATLSFVDRMVPRKTEASYRVRAVAIDGRFSAWAQTGVVTPQPSGAEVIFTSNHRPDLEVVYDYDPESAYQILSTARDEFVAIHGADYQVAFMEAEDRGVGWATGILVNYGDDCPPTLKGGRRIFDPLIALVRSLDVPFVCAMDHQGTRLLGHVTPSDAKQQQPFDIYTAQVGIVPTHTTDIAVVVS